MIMTVSSIRSTVTCFNRPVRGFQLPLWIEIWFGLSALICALDVAYTMLRPLTNRGGPLACIYEPWNLYADVDIRYSTASDIVTMATGRVMVIEIILNIVALFLNRTGSKHTLITAFTTNSMVLWKTVWYMVLYIKVPEGNPEYINPTAPFWQVILCFVIPNSIWILIPSMVLVRLWKDLLVYPPSQALEYPTDSEYPKYSKYPKNPEYHQSSYYYTQAPTAEDEVSGANVSE